VQFFISSPSFLRQYVASLSGGTVVRSKVDLGNLRVLEAELAELAKKHARLGRLRMATFVLLYASVLSNFALPALSAVVETFTLVANLVGVGILSVLALYLTWRLATLWNRMTVVGSHIIAIYEKHNKGSYGIRRGNLYRVRP